MTAAHLRDAAATVAIFGFFASAWFGWAQQRPPKTWRTPLTLASVGSIVLAAVGGVLTWQHWSEGSVFDQDSTARSFGIVVGIEVAAAGIGAALLSRTRRNELTPAWIALVVGIHLVPWRGCWSTRCSMRPPSASSWRRWLLSRSPAHTSSRRARSADRSTADPLPGCGTRGRERPPG